MARTSAQYAKTSYFFNIVDCGRIGKVNRLGYGIVGVELVGCLHLDMVFRRYVVGGDKYVANIGRHLRNVMHGSMFGNFLHQLFGVETTLLGDFLEHGIDFHQDILVHDRADVGNRKKRLDT